MGFAHQPVVMSTAFPACTFSLRHVFDVDHVPAIDIAVRKLAQEGKRPFSAGFFFSLGQSTMVVLASVVVAITAAAMKDRFAAFHDLGSVIDTDVSTTQAAQGMSFRTILVFPALFTTGMSLMDTTGGVLITSAYGWAFINPLRKLWYDLTTTAASVVIALFNGAIEAVGLIGVETSRQGKFWDVIDNLNDDFGDVGLAVVGIFIVAWLFSAVIYRIKGYDRLQVGG